MAAARKTTEASDEAIHKMETVPPPDGEDDAYNAATKIGPMARGLVEAMMAKAQADENSSLPPPVSGMRGLSVPKASRVPTITVSPVSTDDGHVERLHADVDSGDLFDPTALFGAAGNPALDGGTARTEHRGVRSVLDELDGRNVSPPRRSEAEWTKAPTLMAISVVPLPTTAALAPLLEPAAPVKGRRSTFAIEVAIFAGTFLLIAIPAALVYIYWMR